MIRISILVALLSGIATLNATTISFETPLNSTGRDGPVAARALFITAADTLTVWLDNLLEDPASVGQALSGLAFTVYPPLAPSDLASAALLSSEALWREVHRSGAFTDLGIQPTGWALDTSGLIQPGLRLCVLCTDLGAVGPERLILGPPGPAGIYDKANGSIAGNPPHNPFLAATATYSLFVAGVTAASTITSASFAFGTSIGNDIPGEDPSVPEPGTWTLLLAGSALIAGAGWLKRSRRGSGH